MGFNVRYISEFLAIFATNLSVNSFDVFDQTKVMNHVVDNLKGKKVVVYGVATDYCVAGAVDGFLDFNKRTKGKEKIGVIVLTDGIMGVDPEASAQRIKEFMDDEALLYRFDQIEEPLLFINTKNHP